MPLEMKPVCESCGRDLPADQEGALICSLECTFCSDCADGPLACRYPNCGGALERRPTRSAYLLVCHPISIISEEPQ